MERNRVVCIYCKSRNSVAVECDPPPHPRIDADYGGYHDWTSPDNPTYPTLVEYRCHSGRKLVDDLGFFRDHQIIQCQWNKQWTNYDVRNNH